MLFYPNTPDVTVVVNHCVIGRKHVIHSVGPVYDETEPKRCAKLLASCYRRSLEVAAESSLKHISRQAAQGGIRIHIRSHPKVQSTQVQSLKLPDQAD